MLLPMEGSRTTNFWGWGWAERFPDDEARRTLAAMVAAVLGIEPPALRTPPRLEDVTLRPPRLGIPPMLEEMSSASRRDRVEHTYGKGYRDLVRGFSGDFTPAPDFVVRPRDERDIVRVLEWASEEHVAVIPFGGGTSVVGGVEGAVGEDYRGVISLDVRRLDRVLEVDDVSLSARIQAGATGPMIEAQLARHGLTLRHYPQSFEFSTLGGWIATRAGGHYATLYTHIDDRVESVRMITPTGVYETLRVPASGAGPSPERLVLGSEGILGVITEAWVRVHRRPRWRISASVHFADFAAAVAAARAIAQAGLHPANCRLLDATEAMLNGVVNDGHHVLLLGFESADHSLEAWMDRALALCVGRACTHGPVVREGEGNAARDRDAGTWREAFVNAPYLQTALVSLGLVVDTFETACTWDRFDGLHAAVMESVTDAMRRTCGGGRVTCRLTHVYPDGPAPYYTFIAPGRAGREIEQWAAIKQAASEAVLAHGGTITHHHAVGRIHRPWYDRQCPAPFARALRAVKRALDPAWIMNPGVLV